MATTCGRLPSTACWAVSLEGNGQGRDAGHSVERGTSCNTESVEEGRGLGTLLPVSRRTLGKPFGRREALVTPGCCRGRAGRRHHLRYGRSLSASSQLNRLARFCAAQRNRHRSSSPPLTGRAALERDELPAQETSSCLWISISPHLPNVPPLSSGRIRKPRGGSRR